MKTGVIAASIAAASGSLASAQTITTHRIDDRTEAGRTELVLRVSPTTRDVVVAWMHWVTINPSSAEVHVHYNVSTDGLSFRCDPGSVPIPSDDPPEPPDYRGADPTIAFAHDGHAWIGYTTAWDTRFYVASKSPGQPYAAEADLIPYSISSEATDRPVLVAGPEEDDPMGNVVVGMMYSYYHQQNYPTGNDRYRIHAMRSPPCANPPCPSSSLVPSPATTVPVPDCGDPTCYGEIGGSNDVIILHNVEDKVGRWVVAAYGKTGPTCPTSVHARNAVPLGFFSPNGSTDWQESVHPRDATVPCDNCTRSRQEILWFDVCNQSAILPLGGPYVTNIPALAADPRNENTVYMTFNGRTASPDNGTNIDLFIARSVDAGENFSGNPDEPFSELPGDRVLHLRDSDLSDPPDSIQFFPSIAVDSWGTVHVLYYVAWKSTPEEEEEEVEWRYRVKLVSIEDFAVFPHPTNRITPRQIFPTGEGTYFTLDHSLVPLLGGRRFVGDYNLGINARWCEIYAEYIAREAESTAGPRAYVSRIVLDSSRCGENPNCYANCDGSTISPIRNIADFVCFLQRFAMGCESPNDRYANCDGSTTPPFLNVQDFSCFLQKYAAGCQ